MIPTKNIREVRTFENLFEESGLRDDITGLAYQPNIDRLLSLQDLSARATMSNINAITLTSAQDRRRSRRVKSALSDPLNTAFDSKFNRLISFPKANQLIEIKTKADGSLAPNQLTQMRMDRRFGLRNLKGITVDPDTGTLFALNKIAGRFELVRIQPDTDGNFEQARVSRSNIATTIGNARGIALDPTTGFLQVLSPNKNQLYELSQTGDILATRDLSGIVLTDPQALVFAPSGDQTDDPNAVSLYVADNTPGSGGITELSLSEPSSTRRRSATTFVPNLVQTVQTSQFSPASPDPAGISYIDHLNSLLISDSEVEEIPNLFAGANLFEVSLSGTLQSTLATNAVSTSNPAFTKEPTGVSYNPANKFLFISDDDKRKIITVDPSADEQYYTADDSASFFLVTPFGGIDAEDVAYSPLSGTLFIADGLNSEVYEVTTAGALVSQFDTQALGIVDPEGITVGDNGNLFVVGNPSSGTTVGEFTPTGALVRTIDISAANPIKPAGIAFAPSSQNSANRSLYIVDRGIDNNDDPNENDGQLYEFSLGGTNSAGALSFDASTYSVDEDGTAATVQVVRTGGSTGAVSATVSLTDGTAMAPADYNDSPIVASFANGNTTPKTVTIPIVDDSSVEADETVNLSLGSPTNSATIGAQISAVLTILDDDVNPNATLYLSPLTRGTVGGITFADDDILAFNQNTGTYSIYLDGSDLGLSSIDITDFYINPDDSLLFSINKPFTLAGVGSVDDSDIIRFVPSSTGSNTAGTFSLYFDGSDVGLTTNGEDIDALAIAPDGQIIISTKASFSVPGASTNITGADEDLLAFDPTSLGNNTAGTWSVYFDGSDVGLNNSSSEDIDGVWIDDTGELYLTTVGAFDVPGVTGDGSDVFTFTPSSLGSNTSGTYDPFFDGSDAGLPFLVDGVMQIF